MARYRDCVVKTHTKYFVKRLHSCSNSTDKYLINPIYTHPSTKAMSVYAVNSGRKFTRPFPASVTKYFV